MAIAEVERTAWRFPNHEDDLAGVGWLSPSQVNEYRDCPRCFYQNRVLREYRPDTVHFAIGGGLHKVAEYIGRRVMADLEVVNDEAIAVCSDEFDERVIAWTADDDLGKYDELGKAKDDTLRFAAVLLDRLPKLFKERGLIAVEYDLADLPPDVLALAFPFPMRGRMDHLYGDAVTREANAITDLKSSSKMGGPDENGVIQFGIYGLPAYLAGSPWRVGVDVLAKKVTAEMGTYWANGTGVITPEQYAAVHEIVLDVAERINRGDFPVGRGWAGRHNFDHNLPTFTLAVSGFGDAA